MARRENHQLDGWLFISALVGIWLLPATGCQHPGEARRAAARREASLAHTFTIYINAEQQRPQKFARTIDLIEQRVSTDAARTAEWPRRLSRLIERDAERFARRQPVYREEIVRTFSGHPERMEHNAIVLFY